MTVGVNAELMIFGHGPAHDLFVPLKRSAENEECCVCACLPKAVENGFGPLGRAIVEREGDELAADSMVVADHGEAHDSTSVAASRRQPLIGNRPGSNPAGRRPQPHRLSSSARGGA